MRRFVLENRARVRILGGIVLLALVWVLFFDSHSMVRRLQWTHEAAQLRQDNEAMQAEILRLERSLKEANDPEVIERIAREQYGMRRPGETVYRVETK
jgi:cell division protein FtsB